MIRYSGRNEMGWGGLVENCFLIFWQILITFSFQFGIGGSSFSIR